MVQASLSRKASQLSGYGSVYTSADGSRTACVEGLGGGGGFWPDGVTGMSGHCKSVELGFLMWYTTIY
jgi:hypothetical protein